MNGPREQEKETTREASSIVTERARERERERETKSRGRKRGNYSGDIDPAATRQPLSLDSLDSTPTHLYAYTRLSTSSSSPSSPCFPSLSVALHHPSELLFDLLPLFLFFVFLSCSWSSPSLPPLLLHAVRGAVHPSSLLDRRTRKHQHQRDRTLQPPLSDEDFRHDAALQFSCGPSMNPLSLRRPQSSRFALVCMHLLTELGFLACAILVSRLLRTGAAFRGTG